MPAMKRQVKRRLAVTPRFFWFTVTRPLPKQGIIERYEALQITRQHTQKLSRRQSWLKQWRGKQSASVPNIQVTRIWMNNTYPPERNQEIQNFMVHTKGNYMVPTGIAKLSRPPTEQVNCKTGPELYRLRSRN